jgi:hypothetical protein
MCKLLVLAFAVFAIGGISRADSFTVSAAQDTSAINSVASAILGNPMAYIGSSALQADDTNGLAALAAGIILEGTGNLSAADADFTTAQTDLNALLKGLGASPSINFVPAPEPSTLLMLGLGLVGLIAIRRYKASPVAVESAS